MDKPTESFSSIEESKTFIDSVKEKPAGYIALTGLSTALGIAYYRYKKQGAGAKPSLFLMQLRVAAQGTVVGILLCGMLYNMYEQNFVKKKSH